MCISQLSINLYIRLALHVPFIDFQVSLQAFYEIHVNLQLHAPDFKHGKSLAQSDNEEVMFVSVF